MAELRNAVGGAAWKQAAPTSFRARILLNGEFFGAELEKPGQTDSVHRPDRSVARGCDQAAAEPKGSNTKKKGGAMNAPPLKGSDTSVSSPKRQTAEAVRI